MKYTLPIRISGYYEGYNPTYVDANQKTLHPEDIRNDLTEFYEMKRRQEECDHCYEEVDVWDFEDEQNSTFIKVPYASVPAEFGSNKMEYPHCPKCGADLTKGATNES